MIIFSIAAGIACAVVSYVATASFAISMLVYIISVCLLCGTMIALNLKENNDLPFSDLPEREPETEEDLEIYSR